MPIKVDVENARRRAASLREWLRANHPETFEEQKHTDAGTSERAYWLHGYMMAIYDLIQGPTSLIGEVSNGVS